MHSHFPCWTTAAAIPSAYNNVYIQAFEDRSRRGPRFVDFGPNPVRPVTILTVLVVSRLRGVRLFRRAATWYVWRLARLRRKRPDFKRVPTNGASTAAAADEILDRHIRTGRRPADGDERLQQHTAAAAAAAIAEAILYSTFHITRSSIPTLWSVSIIVISLNRRHVKHIIARFRGVPRTAFRAEFGRSCQKRHSIQCCMRS